MSKPQPETPRRSTRLTHAAPLVARNTRPRDSEICTFPGNPTHSRPSVRDDFMEEREWVEANGDPDSDDEREEWDREEKILMTRFYDSFAVSGRRTTAGLARYLGISHKSKPKAKAKAKEPEERYRVGDTVLVHSVNRLPSVGVITSMWENHWTREDDGVELDSKVVKIHWFLRPSELAGVRAKREHQPVRLIPPLYCVYLLTRCYIG